jgi:hypothetical protein
MDKKDTVKKVGHLFNVEILIEGSSNKLALEKLVHLLNSEPVADYKINSGIQLGNIIDATIEENQKELTFQKEEKKKEEKKAIAQQKPENDNKQILHLIHHFKENGTLVRLSIIKGKGVKLNIPCRILNYDAEMDNVSVYHVDEKKVYLLKLNEIDDFIVN